MGCCRGKRSDSDLVSDAMRLQSPFRTNAHCATPITHDSEINEKHDSPLTLFVSLESN